MTEITVYYPQDRD